MGDRYPIHPIRDRTLILRILVPGLETRLRDKMKEAEDSVTPSPGDSRHTSGSNSGNSGSNSSSSNSKEHLLDLGGVTCEPTSADSFTLWNFHCDGATYPARLVNMPCPIELHKTHDHVMYYKCVDIAQMLIVYEDGMALEEAESNAKMEGFSSYYHSGITPPLKKVVERRFALREQTAVAPPRAEVCDVEADLMELMEKISKEGNTTKRTKVPSLTSAQQANKVLEEVVEDVLEYETWMDDYGRQPHGVEFDVEDQLCDFHPEVWLSPDTIQNIRDQIRQAEEEELEKKKKAAVKKGKKKKKKEVPAPEVEAETNTVQPKKGIASKKNMEAVDEVTQAAASMLSSPGDLLIDEDPFFDLDDEEMDFDLEGL